jgi:hypothetical protein
VVLLPLLWGGGSTGVRHLEFQHAYQRVYRLAAGTAVAERPLLVDCELYRRPFTDRRRAVELGLFPNARWELRTDGSLIDRAAVSGTAVDRPPSRPR